MSHTSIDINCDLGEGAGNDAAIMPFISSANIACGFHAGNALTMMETVLLAKQYNVAIGAHPSYFDREHFGRRYMHLDAKSIYALVLYQLGALDAFCRAENVSLHHVKPHGALYNQAAEDPAIAAAVAHAIRDYDAGMRVYGLSGSWLITEAKALGLVTVAEVFADRTYTGAGSLTPRSEPGALLDTPEKVIAQSLSLALQQQATATDGTSLRLAADTICLHGDHPQAGVFVKAIHNAFADAGIRIQSPA